MCIIRVEHHRNYTCISNEAIRDNRLSFKARGIHHLLLTYPNNWEAKVEHLIQQSDKDGRSSVMSGLDELEDYGYLARKQLRDQAGRFIGWQVIVREMPEAENPITVKTASGSTDCGKSTPIINTEVKEYPIKEISTPPLTPLPTTLAAVQEEKREEKRFVEVAKPEPLELITKRSSTPPLKEKIAEVSKQLREIRINPDEFTGLVQKYWENVQGAITYVKQGIEQGWCKNPIALFRTALKEGRRPTETSTQRAVPEEVRPPTEEQTLALEQAKREGKIRDYYFSGDGITKVVKSLFDFTPIPWWEYLSSS